MRAHNYALHGYNHGDELAGNIRSACGVTDGSIKEAVTLNKLDDLAAFHKSVTA